MFRKVHVPIYPYCQLVISHSRFRFDGLIKDVASQHNKLTNIVEQVLLKIIAFFS